MEATGSTSVGGAVPDGAAAAAFSGVVLGVFGMLRQAAMWRDYYRDPGAQLLADVAGHLGESLSMLSVLGVVYLIWGALRGTGRRAALLGVALLSLLLAAEAVGIASSVSRNTGDRWQGYGEFPNLEAAAFYAIHFLPPLVLLPFSALSLRSREKKIGALVSALCVLAVPFVMLRLLLFPPDFSDYAEPSFPYALFALGWYPAGVSLLEAPLWVLLGVVLLRGARSRALGEAFRVRERENLAAARRLYEESLGRGDASAVDDLVSEDFRDLRRGSRGRLGMERVFSDLWRSYPDLAVSIEDQEAEDDLVRTRLILSGTDRGGVLWYPPTGKRATFTAAFVDRFLDGRLIEHSGAADTEDLLRQLGLTGTHAPAEPQAAATKKGASRRTRPKS